MEGNNITNLSKLSYATLEKRFDFEFEKIEKIGKGGFASVYKVRNFLDNSLYAIKKIKLKIDDSKQIQKDIITVLQEVRYLAKIKSEFIVTYNHSWVEVNLKIKDDNRSKFSCLETVESRLKSKISKKKNYITNEFSSEINHLSARSSISIELLKSIETKQKEKKFDWDESLSKSRPESYSCSKTVYDKIEESFENEQNLIKIGNNEYRYI
jgi:hypothetical protein